MDDFDLLGNQLHELAQRAPVPVADPLLDIRRGRRAVRRRHVRDVAGVSAALVAVAAIATTFPSLQLFGGDGTITASTPAYSTSSTSSPPTSSRPSAATDPCTINGGTAVAEARQRAPEVAAAVAAYREAAAATLDPSGEHLDPADSKRPESVQSSSYCDPEVGEQLASLGAKIGWTEDGALGVIQLEVVSPGHDVEPQIVLNHSGWAAYGGRLPTGVSKARVTNYSKDGGGHAVIVERFDGLSVAIDAAATWGNNAAPGSPPTTDLPGVKKLVQLAADPALTLPKL